MIRFCALVLALLTATASAETKPTREDQLELENIELKQSNIVRVHQELSARKAQILDKYGMMIDAKGQIVKKPDPKKPEIKKP